VGSGDRCWWYKRAIMTPSIPARRPTFNPKSLRVRIILKYLENPPHPYSPRGSTQRVHFWYSDTHSPTTLSNTRRCRHRRFHHGYDDYSPEGCPGFCNAGHPHWSLCRLWRYPFRVSLSMRFALRLASHRPRSREFQRRYDTGTIGGILAMPYWRNQFSTGFTNPIDGQPDVTSSQSSLIVSILSAGTFFGALTASPFGDLLGRRMGLVASSWVFIFGVILQVISTTIPLFTAGRFFAGYGVGLISALGNSGSALPP
jgi:hypothetical protein